MPKILPKPLFDPKNPSLTPSVKKPARPSIVGFAEGGTVSVGPAGRTFAQIQSAGGYLNPAERAWYLTQLYNTGTPLGNDAIDFLNQQQQQASQALTAGLNLFNKSSAAINAGMAKPVIRDMQQEAYKYATAQGPALEPSITEGNIAAAQRYDDYQRAASETAFAAPEIPKAPDKGFLGNVLDTVGSAVKSVGDIQLLPDRAPVNPLPTKPATFRDLTRTRPTGLDTTLGDVVGAGYDAYMTDIPYYSDFARETLIPAAGKVGKFAGDAYGSTAPGILTNQMLKQLGADTGQVGKFVAEAAVPVTAGDVALELTPAGTAGDIADISRGLSRGVRATEQVSDALMNIAARISGVNWSYGDSFAGIPLTNARAQQAIRMLKRIADGEDVGTDELSNLIEEIRWAKNNDYIPPRKSPEDNMNVRQLSDVLAKELGTSVKNLPPVTETGLATRMPPPAFEAPELTGALDELVETVAAKPTPPRPRPVQPAQPQRPVTPEPDVDAPTIRDTLFDTFDPEDMTKGKANQIINQLRKAGYDVSDLEAAADEFAALRRADFDDAEEFADAKFSAWEDFGDTLMTMDEPDEILDAVVTGGRATPPVRDEAMERTLAGAEAAGARVERATPAVQPPTQGQVVRIAAHPGALDPVTEGLVGSRGALTVRDPSRVRVLGPGEQPARGEMLFFHGTGGPFEGDPRAGMFVTPNEADAELFMRIDQRTRAAGMTEEAAPAATPAAPTPRGRAAAPKKPAGLDTQTWEVARQVVAEFKANPTRTTPNTTLSNLTSILDSLPGGRSVNVQSGKSPRSRAKIVAQIEERLAGQTPAAPAGREAGPVVSRGRTTPAAPDPSQIDEGATRALSESEDAAIERTRAMLEGPKVAKFTKAADGNGYAIKVNGKIRATIRKVKNGEWAIIDPTGARYPGLPSTYPKLTDARADAKEFFEGVPPAIAEAKAIPTGRKPVVPQEEARPTLVTNDQIKRFNSIQTSPVRKARWSMVHPKAIEAATKNLLNLSHKWMPDRTEEIGRIRDLLDAQNFDEAQRIFDMNLQRLHAVMSKAVGVPHQIDAVLPLADEMAEARKLLDEPIEMPSEVPAPRARQPRGTPTPAATPKPRATRRTTTTSPTTRTTASARTAPAAPAQAPAPTPAAAGGGAGVPPSPPLGSTSAIPNPSGGAPKVPRARVGHKYVTPLLNFRQVMGEVVPATNKAVEWLVGRTGINPSVLEDTPVGKALVAYARQRISGREASHVVLSALDEIGNGRKLFRPDKDGFIPVGNERLKWGDLFSNKKYDRRLTPEQRRYVRTYREIIIEGENLRRASGLRPRKTSGVGQDSWMYYIPRQVESIRGKGENFLFPSNPTARRIYETQKEGVAHGIKYNDDPREVLATHLNQMYNEIINKQMSRELAQASRSPSELVSRNVIENFRNTTAAQRKWESEVERLRWNRATTNDFPEYKKAKAWHQKLEVAEQELKKAQDARTTATQQYKAAFARLQNQRTVISDNTDTGWMFGEKGPVSVGKWRNRWFKEEDYLKLQSTIDGVTGRDLRPQASGVAKGVSNIGDFVRLMSATADFGAPFIHGLPVLARNPVAWGKATAAHYKAFFSPQTQARYMRQHRKTFEEMAQNGVPIGDLEIFKAISDPGSSIPRRVARSVPGAKRFQASYDTFLAISRAELWEGLKHLDPTERARLIRNMTGGLDSGALGVAPHQAAIESALLAFSPRLLRSTLGLVAQAAEVNTPAGREALKTLGALTTGAMGVTLAANYAMGNSWEDMLDPDSGMLNPLSGKEFLSVKLGDNWVGIGGQVRALGQFMAKGYAAAADGDLGAFTSADLYENPLLAFYVSRGAPFVNTALGVTEAFTGWDTLPYENLVDDDASFGDRLWQFANFGGESLLPFTLQSMAESMSAGTDMKTALKTAGAAFLGFRSSDETKQERRQEIVPQAIDRAVTDGRLPQDVADILKNVDGWSDLTSRERRAIAPYYEEFEPGLLTKIDQEVAENGDIFAQKRIQIDKYWEEKTPQLDDMFKDFMEGASGGTPAVMQARRRQLEKMFQDEAGMHNLDEDYQDAIEGLETDDIRKLTNAYYNIFDQYANETDAEVRSSLIEADQKRLLERTTAADPAAGDRLAFNTTFEAPDPSDHQLLRLWSASRETLDSYRKVDPDGREQWRKENPEEDFKLWFWGYVTTLKSPEAVHMADQYVTGRNIKADFD